MQTTRREIVKCGAGLAAIIAAGRAPSEIVRSMIAAKNAMSIGRPELRTLNLKGASIAALPCNINGLTNATLFAWARNLENYWIAPSWAENGGWGATYFGKNGDTIEVRFGSGSSDSKKQFSFVVADNEWHHYCFVRDASGSTGSYRFYFDGQLSGTESGNKIAMKNNQTSFRLANGMYGAVPDREESIVAYGVFSRELSDNEVEQVYNARLIDTTKAPFNSGLIMGMNVTEGEGDKVYDVVSGSYVTISSTPNWTVDFNP